MGRFIILIIVIVLSPIILSIQIILIVLATIVTLVVNNFTIIDIVFYENLGVNHRSPWQKFDIRNKRSRKSALKKKPKPPTFSAQCKWLTWLFTLGWPRKALKKVYWLGDDPSNSSKDYEDPS